MGSWECGVWWGCRLRPGDAWVPAVSADRIRIQLLSCILSTLSAGVLYPVHAFGRCEVSADRPCIQDTSLFCASACRIRGQLRIQDTLERSFCIRVFFKLCAALRCSGFLCFAQLCKAKFSSRGSAPPPSKGALPPATLAKLGIAITLDSLCMCVCVCVCVWRGLVNLITTPSPTARADPPAPP